MPYCSYDLFCSRSSECFGIYSCLFSFLLVIHFISFSSGEVWVLQIYFRFINAECCSGSVFVVCYYLLLVHTWQTLTKQVYLVARLAKDRVPFSYNCLGIISIRFYQCCQLYAKDISERMNYPRTTS